MKLYFSPLACSLASRIALYEASLEADYVRVDLRTQQLPDGTDFGTVNPLGKVPVLATDEGALLFENAAILQHVAALAPGASERGTRSAAEALLHEARVRQWLSFVGTELHSGLFARFFGPPSPEAVREHALARGERYLAHVNRHLEGRRFLLDAFSVADAYLFTALGWAPATPVKLERYPALVAYRQRLLERPSVARAFSEELALYQAPA